MNCNQTFPIDLTPNAVLFGAKSLVLDEQDSEKISLLVNIPDRQRSNLNHLFNVYIYIHIYLRYLYVYIYIYTIKNPSYIWTPQLKFMYIYIHIYLRYLYVYIYIYIHACSRYLWYILKINIPIYLSARHIFYSSLNWFR